MELNVAITEFMYSRDLSPGTKRLYRSRLGELSRWLAAEGVAGVGAITPGHVRGYLAYLSERPGRVRRRGEPVKPLDSHTLNGHARALRAFLRWAASEELVPASLPKKVVMPRLAVKILPVLSEAQTDALFAACAHTTQSHRDRAILAVLLDTGVRASELTGLTMDRVFFSQDDAWLLVHGKGRKSREVGLGRRSRSLLHRYIHRVRGTAPGPVFLSRRTGGALTLSGLQLVLYALRDRAGLRGVRVGPHVWRHTYATRFIAANGDIFRLARLMGHSSLSVTQGYLTSFSAREARRGFSVLDGR